MPLEDELLALEAGFWKGDADFYQRHLTPDAVMAFADPVGVLTRAQVLRAIDDEQRWSEVSFEDSRLLFLTDQSCILSYKARARRGSGHNHAYIARACSAYVHTGERWKMGFHQQTPAT